VLTALPHIIQLSAEARVMTYGAVLIFTILLLPKGIWGTAAVLLKRLPIAGRAKAAKSSAPSVELR